MAAGRPVLGSIAGETPYVIEQAQCGFCAPPGDAQALAQAVQRFLAAPDAIAMGRRAREYYEAHFTKKNHIDRLERMLLDLCGGE